MSSTQPQESVDNYAAKMPSRFSTAGLLALSFMLTSTWAGTGASVGIGIEFASMAGTIWALPVAAVMTMIVSLGMAELASAYPSAGGQYYWSFMVASEDYRAVAAFVNGWLSVAGWWLGTASATNFLAAMILGLVTLWMPNYEILPWHQWLCYAALNWVIVAMNVYGSKMVSILNQLTMYFAILTLSGTTIALLVCSRDNYPSGRALFGDIITSTGWGSNGMGFVLAIANSVYGFLGTDCAAHMAEEIDNPGKNVPRAMLWPIVIGLFTAFPFTIACMAAISNLDAVLGTTTGLPLVEIYYQGTGSIVATTILMSFFAFCFFMCAAACATTCSRTLWALSRDGALPFSNIWAQVDSRFEMPVKASCLSATVVCLYGLIFLGSSTAFSAMVNTTVIFLQTSCIFPQLIILFRGRANVLPPRYFDLGAYGYAINIVAVAWVIFLDVIYCLPSTWPVTPTNMSYVSVVTVGVLLLISILWLTVKRKTFKGPEVNMAEVSRRRETALGIHIINGSAIADSESKTRTDIQTYSTYDSK